MNEETCEGCRFYGITRTNETDGNGAELATIQHYCWRSAGGPTRRWYGTTDAAPRACVDKPPTKREAAGGLGR